MPDALSISIGENSFSGFTGYRIEHNIYDAAGSFSVEISPSVFRRVSMGQRLTIRVNGKVALVGTVERIEDQGDKSSRTIRISGRDLMGMVVDEYITSFHTLRNKKLSEVALKYLQGIDGLKSVNVTFLDGSDALDVPQEYVQPRPGQRVFDLLSGIAASRGMHFYMLPEGSLVFGKPKGYGKHTFRISRTPNDSNVLGHGFVDDITQRYSDVTVVGQCQSTGSRSVIDLNKKVTATDSLFPPFFNKHMVVETQTAAETLTEQARYIIEQMRFAGWALKYTVPGHAQMGDLWRPDTLVSVDDRELDIRGEYLIYSRSFNLSKAAKSTDVIIGKKAGDIEV